MEGRVRGTTVLAVRRDGVVAMAADGQITIGDVVMKHKALKTRRLYKGKVLAGFAGSAADAITLLERFESRLEQHAGNLRRSAVELAKEWRTDKYLRRLEAWLIVADAESMLVLSGDGEVIEPDAGLCPSGLDPRTRRLRPWHCWTTLSCRRQRSPEPPWKSPPVSASTPIRPLR